MNQECTTLPAPLPPTSIIFILGFVLSLTHKSWTQEHLNPWCYYQDPHRSGEATWAVVAMICPWNLGWAGCGSLPGSPRPAGRQQPCLVLVCAELCWEEGGCVRQWCLGICVREKDILVCLYVRMCLCVHACAVDLLQCEYIYMSGEKRSEVCAEIKENQLNSGLFWNLQFW